MADWLISGAGMFFFWLALLLSLLVIPAGLPGTFMITALALFHGWVTNFDPITGTFVFTLLGIAVAGEVVEFFFGAATAKKYGGSKWAMSGAVIGGFAGAVVGTGMFPVLGTLVGAFLGAFVGAMLAELLAGGSLLAALKAGYGAMLGTIGGKLSKVILGIIMIVMIGFRIV